MAQESTIQDGNKAIVRASFERWRSGTGGPFELLTPDAEWTIVGSSPLSKTYHSRQEFLDQVINPFNARMATPLIPSVRGLYADGDMVIILFDASAMTRDDRPYRNTYTWYFQMKDAKVVKAIAFFDTREFDEFWTRVAPAR
jgi:ketosteroid isomerase-like protein